MIAQQSFIVPAGENADAILPKPLRFLNPSFKMGYLVYVNDSETKPYNLNIDLYCECVAYINDKSDTTLINHTLNIKGLKIGTEDFEHLKKIGFVKVLASNSMYRLVSHVKFIREQIQEQVNVGYGTVPKRSVTSSVNSNRALTDVKFSRVTEWLLLDQRSSILKADKKNFLKMFHDKEDQIKSLMKSERIKYDNEEDLIKLFLICIKD